MERRIVSTIKYMSIALLFVLIVLFTMTGVRAESIEIANRLVVLYDSVDHDFSSLDIDHQKVDRVENKSDLIDIVYLKSSKDETDLKNQISACESVKSVDSEAIVKAESVPNDTLYNDHQSYLKTIGFEDIVPGKNKVKVAVIDTGVDADHEDLLGRVDETGYNYVNENQNTRDLHGHGTAVAGIIAAQTDNNTGIAGAVGSADVSIVPYIALGHDGSGYVSSISAALEDIKKRDDIKIINLSLGLNENNDVLESVCNDLNRLGKIVVAASGNAGEATVAAPASYSSTLAVGAVNNDLKRCTEADWGKGGSNYGIGLDLVAPGDQIACPTGGKGYTNAYHHGDGTSFAAPIVSAACALAATRDSSVNLNSAREAVKATSRDLESTGWDNETGYGLIQLDKFSNEFTKDFTPILNVTGIKISGEKERTLKVGDHLKLEAKLEPLDAPGTIEWSSSKPDVVSVDASGNLSAIAKGTSTITAKYGAFTDTVTVTVTEVEPELESITISGDKTLNLKTEDLLTLKAVLKPDGITRTITWKSSNPSVATVDNGNVKALASGESTITAESDEKSDSVKVIVTQRVKGIRITDGEKIELELNQERALTAVLEPDGAEGTIGWISSDSKVATVDSKGTVKAVSSGTCDITAVCEDSTTKITVVVKAQSAPSIPTPSIPSSPPAPSVPSTPSVPNTPSVPSTPPANTNVAVKSVSVSPTSQKLEVAKTVQLKATISPSNATNKALTWSSSNKNVAEVSTTGLVTAKAAGTATISVTTKDGNHKASCSVTVVAVQKPENNTPQQPNTPTPNVPTPNTPSQPQTPTQDEPRPTNPTQPVEQIQIYRLYNPGNSEHLYTSDEHERDVLAASGWKDEGTGWISPTTGDPVYRVYSDVAKEHLYTKDQSEVQALTASGAWTVDNGGNPLFYSGGSKPIYRLYNESLMRHHLTTDEYEYNVLKDQGWKQEGVALNCVQ